tara:strand:+ start:172 stop:894 length:723 start_codon:yes stop_codon:yes gene_type:complete
MRTGIIVQCRYNSTRLQGKILKKVNNKTLLEYLIDRLKTVISADDICIAYSENPLDKKISSEIEKFNIKSYMGPEDDVLARYYYTAKKFDINNIVRVTSDCPIIDPSIIDNLIRTFKNSNIDYLSNSLERSYPLGMEAEIFNFKSLEKSHMSSLDHYEREHVTAYMRKSDLFKKKSIKLENNFSQIRLTLDTIEDFDLISIIIKELYPKFGIEFGLKNILEFLNKYPKLLEINQGITQKS